MLMEQSAKRKLLIVGGALTLSAIHIFLLWGFWSHGYHVLGLNVILFGLVLLGYFYLANQQYVSRRDALWIVPIGLIFLSTGIYYNPFVAIINIIVLPLLFLIFTTHSSYWREKKKLWSGHFIFSLIESLARWLASFAESVGFSREFRKEEMRLNDTHKNIAGQVIVGGLFFAVIGSFVIIPLLSSADAAFADIFEDFFANLTRWLSALLSPAQMIRTIAAVMGFFAFLAFAYYWHRGRALQDVQNLPEKNYDDNAVAIGTFLVGNLVLYIVFLVLQIRTLFLSMLPADFATTEQFVKTGFWQLFALTLINGFFYVLFFARTRSWVQCILGIFTAASFLLIVSATHKVYLYVATYGLSYEKFFALYTTIFSCAVFVWFLYLIVMVRERRPLFKNVAFAALWMYALVIMLPIERMIFSYNFTGTQKEDSRIDINEARMLSSDTLPLVGEKFEQLLALSVEDYKLKKARNAVTDISEEDLWYVKKRWYQWYAENADNRNNIYYFDFSIYEQVEKNKKWYEKSLTSFGGVGQISIDQKELEKYEGDSFTPVIPIDSNPIRDAVN